MTISELVEKKKAETEAMLAEEKKTKFEEVAPEYDTKMGNTFAELNKVSERVNNGEQLSAEEISALLPIVDSGLSDSDAIRRYFEDIGEDTSGIQGNIDYLNQFKDYLSSATPKTEAIPFQKGITPEDYSRNSGEALRRQNEYKAILEKREAEKKEYAENISRANYDKIIESGFVSELDNATVAEYVNQYGTKMKKGNFGKLYDVMDDDSFEAVLTMLAKDGIDIDKVLGAGQKTSSYRLVTVENYDDILSAYGLKENVIEAFNDKLEDARKEAKTREWSEKIWSVVGANAFTKALGVGATFALKGVTDLGSLANIAVDAVMGKEVGKDDFSQASKVMENIRARVGEDGNGVAKFLYNVELSLGDMIPSIAVGMGFSPIGEAKGLAESGKALEKVFSTSNITSGIMSSSAFASTVRSYKELGYSNEDAITLGTVAGLAEFLTEKYSLETLLEGKTAELINRALSEKGGKKALNYALATAIQGFTEGSEEVASDVINWLFEDFYLGKDSEFNKAISEYLASGEAKNEIEAVKYAALDKSADILMSFLAGAVSGAVMGGASAISNDISVKQYFKEDYNRRVSQMQDIISQSNVASVANKINASELSGNVIGDIHSKSVKDAYAKVSAKGTLVGVSNDTELSKTVSEIALSPEAQATAYKVMQNADDKLAKAIGDYLGQRITKEDLASNKDGIASAYSVALVCSGLAGYSNMFDANTISAYLSQWQNLSLQAKKESERDIIADKARNAQEYKNSGIVEYSDNVSYDSLNAKQKSVLRLANFLSERYGLNFLITEDANSKVYGQYDNGVIRLNIAGGKSNSGIKNIAREVILPTLSHEIVHEMKEKAPKSYALLKSVVTNMLGADTFASRMEMVKKSVFEATGETISDELAEEEVIAKASEDILSKTSVMREFQKKMGDDNAEAFGSFLGKIITKVSGFFDRTMNSESAGSIATELRNEYGKFTDALVNAYERGITAISNTDTVSESETTSFNVEDAPKAEETKEEAKETEKAKKKKKRTGKINRRASAARFATKYADYSKKLKYDSSEAKEIVQKALDSFNEGKESKVELTKNNFADAFYRLTEIINDTQSEKQRAKLIENFAKFYVFEETKENIPQDTAEEYAKEFAELITDELSEYGKETKYVKAKSSEKAKLEETRAKLEAKLEDYKSKVRTGALIKKSLDSIKATKKGVKKMLTQTKGKGVKTEEVMLAKTILEATNFFADKPDPIDLLIAYNGNIPDSAKSAYEDIVSLYDSRDGMTESELKENDRKIAKAISSSKAIKDIIKSESEKVKIADFTDIMSRISSEYKSLATSSNDYIQQAYDETVDAHIAYATQLISLMYADEARDWQSAEYNLVAKTLREVLHTIRKSNSLFGERASEKVSEQAESVIAELIPKKEVKVKRDREGNLKTSVVKNYSYDIMKPAYVFRRIGSKTLEKMYWDLVDGRSKAGLVMQQATDFVEEVKKELGLKNVTAETKKTFDIQLDSGRTANMTIANAMSIYAYSRRAIAYQHMTTGGIMLSSEQATPYILTKKDIERITDVVRNKNEKLIDFVERLTQFSTDTLAQLGNKVSHDLYGEDIFGEENYFGIHSSNVFLQGMKADSKTSSGVKLLKNNGATIPTVPRANNPIQVGVFFDDWAKHAQFMSNYYGMVLPLENITRVLNYKTKNDSGESVSVESVMNSRLGDYAFAYLKRLISDFNGTAVSDTFSFADKATKLWKASNVAGSVSTILQQPTAIIRAMAYINPKYFNFTAFKDSTLKVKQTYAEAMKYCGVYVLKRMGGVDIATGYSSPAYIKGEVPALDKVEEIAMTPAALADEIGWSMIWDAAKNEIADKYKNTVKVGSKEYFDLVSKRSEYVINLTQVYDDVASRSQIMRKRGLGIQALTAYMAEPITQLNMTVDAFMELIKSTSKDGRITGAAAKQFTATVTSVIMSAVAAALVVAPIYAGRDKDKKKSLTEKILSEFTEQMIDNINPLNGLPYIKDVWSIVNGYSVYRPDTEIIRNTVDFISGTLSDIINGKGVKAKDIEALAKALQPFFPVYNITRDATAIFNIVASMFDDIGFPSIKHILKAMESGAKDATGISTVENLATASTKAYNYFISGNEEAKRLYNMDIVPSMKWIPKDLTSREEDTFTDIYYRARDGINYITDSPLYSKIKTDEGKAKAISKCNNLYYSLASGTANGFYKDDNANRQGALAYLLEQISGEGSIEKVAMAIGYKETLKGRDAEDTKDMLMSYLTRLGIRGVNAQLIAFMLCGYGTSTETDSEDANNALKRLANKYDKDGKLELAYALGVKKKK